MCTDDGRGAGSIAEALRMAHASLDYLNSPAAAELAASACGPVLSSLGELQAKVTAACAGSTRPAPMTPTGTARRRPGWPR